MQESIDLYFRWIDSEGCCTLLRQARKLFECSSPSLGEWIVTFGQIDILAKYRAMLQQYAKR